MKALPLMAALAVIAAAPLAYAQSASTLGAGSSTGGSAAISDGGKATSSNKVHDNPNMMQDQAKARAQDGGTWSKSMTDTKLKQGELDSRTKSMSHEPGGPPAKSTSTAQVPITK